MKEVVLAWRLMFWVVVVAIVVLRMIWVARSNCAKDSRMLSVSRPMEVVVLNCWVTETNDTPLRSKTSTSLAKSDKARVKRSILYTTTISTSPASISAMRRLRPGRSKLPPE